LGFFGCKGKTNSEHKAQIGLLDLSGWNVESGSSIVLAGEWEFYWKELYSKHTLTPRDPENNQHYIQIPGVWNGRRIGNETLSGPGYATLRLQILLPESERPIALRIPDNFYSVHAIWINGIKKEWNGIPGTNPDNTDFIEHDQSEFLLLEDRAIDLIIEVSNFRGNTRWGGLRYPILVAKSSVIRSEINKQHFLSFFIFSSIISIGIYHLFFFRNYRKDRLPLYFALFCFTVAAYSIATSNAWISLFPKMGPNALFKTEFLLELLLTPACFVFLYNLFPQDLSKTLMLVFLAFIGITILTLLVLPIEIVSQFYGYSLYIPLIFGTYLLFMILKVFYLRRKFSGTILFSVIVLFIFMLNDVLNGMLNFVFLAPYSFPIGLLIFIGIHSHMIAMRQADAYRNAEELVYLQNKYNEQVRRQAEERARIARDIHDSIGSEITALMTYISIGESVEDVLNKVKKQLTGILINIRDIVYLLGQERKGSDILEGEIQKYIERLRSSKKYEIKAEIDTVSTRLGIERSLNLQRIFLEVMTNILRHSKSNTIRIVLRGNQHSIRLLIINDGIRFTWNPNLAVPGSFGLEGIQIRAQKLGAKVKIYHRFSLNVFSLRILL
jgi:signal transduction histidine kinase